MPLNPSLARVAGSAFHNNRHRKGSDMYCNPYGLTPLSGGGAESAYRFMAAPSCSLHRMPQFVNRGQLCWPRAPHGIAWGHFAARIGRLFLLWEDGLVYPGDRVIPTGKQLDDIVHAE